MKYLKRILAANPKLVECKILRTGAKKWKTTVDHARQCIIDDRRICLYNSSTEYITGVVFDTVGQLKGVLRNNQFVPIESVYEAEKAEAQKLLASAFENRRDITYFGDETSFLHQFPCISNDKNVTNSSGLDGSDGWNSSIFENIDRNDPTQPVTSSQGISSSINHSNSSLEPPSEASFRASSISMSESDLDSLLESFREIDALFSPIFSNNDNQPEIHRVESYSDHQSNAGSIRFVGAVITLQWLFRVRKRVASVGDSQVHKRQRQS